MLNPLLVCLPRVLQIAELLLGMETLNADSASLAEKQSEFTSASAAVLSARREQRDVAAVEAFMLAELSLRREKARMAALQTKLAPIEKMVTEHQEDLSAIQEHLASVALRDSISRTPEKRGKTPEMRAKTPEKRGKTAGLERSFDSSAAVGTRPGTSASSTTSETPLLVPTETDICFLVGYRHLLLIAKIC